MHPLLLLIHMEGTRAMRFGFAAMSQGVQVRVVSAAQTGETLAALCGLETIRNAPPLPVTEEMMVFAFLPDAALTSLLSALRQTGLPPVRLRAVLTPHNRDWSCARLQKELACEAAAFHAGKEGEK